MPAMRCKHCRYRLENLPDNRCPECGNAFDPNDPETLYDPSIANKIMILLMIASYIISYLFVLFTLPNFMPDPTPPPLSERLPNAIPEAIAPTAIPLVFFLMCWSVIDLVHRRLARREQD